jgi:hypothetical protein
MAFVDDCNLVANLWLRSGDANTANNFVAFLEDTLRKLKGKNLSLLRLDSGFYDQNVFEFLEEKSLSYVVAAKFYKPIQIAIRHEKLWLKLDEGIEIAETMYQSPQWKEPRRMVMVRQLIEKRPKAAGKQLKLFKEEGIVNQYRYSCYITNLSLSAADVWRLYRQRANAENKIKELKYDFGFDSFNLDSFWATEAALNFVMVAYNLMSLFRHLVINSETQSKLSTLRFQVFAIGAYLVKEGREVVLKMSLPLKRRQWFVSLWEGSKKVKPPNNVPIA